MIMKLGIDIGCLQRGDAARAGISRHVLGLLTGLNQLEPRPEVTLYICAQTAAGEARALEVLRSRELSFPVRRYYRPPGRPHNLRMRLNSRRSVSPRPDAFQVITDQAYKVRPEQLRSVLIPDLSVLHAPEFHSEEDRAFGYELFKHAQKHADLVVMYSQHTRSDVIKSFGIPASKVVAVPLAADDCYKPMPEADVRVMMAAWALPYRKYLLTVGTIELRKNLTTLFRAYVQYRRRAGEEALPLVVAGAPGWLHQEIVDEPARLGIADAVRFMGRVDGLEYLYNGAAAFVYPSLFEGFGRRPLEAMACGISVIASNATSLPEVVQDAGLLFHPVDDRALAEHLLQITADPALRSQCTARGLAVARQFSWRKTAQAYVAAIGKAVERHRHASREVVTSGT